MAEGTKDQVESVRVSDALDVERLDLNLYRSKSTLWLPPRARGVFGGQVISQALVSATNCVDPALSLHSLHCYFLLSASPSIPIIYHVDRVRDGRSYSTRAVRAVQNGKAIFIMVCSFQRPEPWQPSVKWEAPPNVARPEECEWVYERSAKEAETPGINLSVKEYLLEYAEERKKSFLEIKSAGVRASAEGHKSWMYWFRVSGMPECDTSFQKCILSYVSDSHFIRAASATAGLHALNRGEKRLGMVSTLDHSIYFYNDSFDCGDWMLYVTTSPSVGSGRGVVHGRMYTANGTLIAIMTQEGVVRADIKAPSVSTSKL